MELDFVKVEISRLQICKVRKKSNNYCKGIFWIYESLEQRLLSEHFQKINCSEVYDPIIGCTLPLLTFIWILSKVFAAAILEYHLETIRD